MKKYIFTLVPLLMGVVLCLIFSAKEAAYRPDTSFPYVTRESFNHLATSWLLIGFGLSCMFLVVLVVYDVSTWIEKVLERRSMYKKDKV